VVRPNDKKNNWVTYLLIAGVVALIGVNIAYVVSSGGLGGVAEGEEAPGFTLPLLQASAAFGKEVSLAKLEGKVVLLEFWSTS